MNAVENFLSCSSSLKDDYWQRIYEKKEFPEEYWQCISKNRVAGIIVSKENGGMGMSIRDFCDVVERTARYHAGSASYLFLSSSLSAFTIEKIGKEWMKKEVLPDLVSGKKRLCVALSEEEAGLDAYGIRTSAIKKGKNYIINGAKSFVSNLDRADFVLLFAKTDEGITCFIADARDKSLEKKALRKIGLDFMNVFSLRINSLELSDEHVISEPGRGFKAMKSIFVIDRLATAASLVGTSWLALESASRHANSRMIFGKPIGSNQGIQFPIADSACRLVSCEALIAKACYFLERGMEDYVNLALLEAQKASFLATDRALQTLGGHGYIEDYGISRHWKDVRAYRVHPVSEELLLASIAYHSLGLEKTY